MNQKTITSLYEQYKNTNKKLKIVCDWDEEESIIEYSPYGFHLMKIPFLTENTLKKQQELKNSPNFYQQAPFLTIAEDLLKLIKEGKVESLIFLSAYDKRKFPTTDLRKVEIFNKTFGKFLENASDFDLVIDDNPNICNSLIEAKEEEEQNWRDHGDECYGCSDCQGGSNEME
ncbi:3449_t:CDS:2 [Funneliformis geosporum]|uniref:3449_t:CDS:1 n=1 Tax=Funneliformis geosporum TaxID=1117311 RepID=A0A9W4X095_9GLOM|nr:3449_t:CDS:2 [Funneliformis geosporum]